MSDAEDDDPLATLPSLLALMVHDLRNPAATIGANLSFLKELQDPDGDPDLIAAMGDAEIALEELLAGLERVHWLGKWIRKEPVVPAGDGDVGDAVRAFAGQTRAKVVTVVPDGRHRARGAAALPRLLAILVSNAGTHAPGKPITLRVSRDGDTAIVLDFCDEGLPVQEALRATVFTASGQDRSKSVRGGRYGRALGLFAARLVADAMGATLECREEAGKNVFRIWLESVPIDV